MGNITNRGRGGSGELNKLETINSTDADSNKNIDLISNDFLIQSEGNGQVSINLIPPFSVNLASLSPSTAEIGSTVSEVTLNWSYSDDSLLNSQELDQGIGVRPVAERSFVHSGLSLTSNTTYTIDAEDSTGQTDSDSSTLRFISRVFADSTASAANLVEADIESATLVNVLASSRGRSITFSPSGNYVFYAYPKSYGLATVKDENGFVLTAWRSGGVASIAPYEVSITNSFGYTQDYYVYHSFNTYGTSSLTLTWS